MIPQPLSRDGALADIRRRLNDLESSPDLYGATITGGILRTAADGPRIEIRPDLWPTGWEGIRLYDATGNTGVPEIKTDLAGGSLYLTSGEVVSGGSGNAELRLSVGGDWRLGSTHLPSDTFLQAISGALFAAAAGTPGTQTYMRLQDGSLYLGSTDAALSFRTGFSVTNGGNDAHVDAPDGTVYLSSHGGDVNINTDFAGGTAWLASDAGDVKVNANGTVYVSAATGDVNLNSQTGTAWLTSDGGDVHVQASGDVSIACGATGGVYFTQTGPTVTGVTSNVYMDPTTGKMSRIV